MANVPVGDQLAAGVVLDVLGEEVAQALDEGALDLTCPRSAMPRIRGQPSVSTHKRERPVERTNVDVGVEADAAVEQNVGLQHLRGARKNVHLHCVSCRWSRRVVSDSVVDEVWCG